MQGYNVLMIYSKDMDRLLMCKRLKNPYKGLSNLVGGKSRVEKRGLKLLTENYLKKPAFQERM
ncbi:hypothetical protein QFZ77_004505 [Paenibacillus sp. V4I3]|uniref:hypothetical protein n=1 Tax=unclassified Paenibacillus TaxID=185978 RepID=UPI00277D9316|nr:MULTISPECIES: hypothetical protein [unclassified Paenibacillus]MDQ0875846.1 hypothetical protein [Paenibacillus sp. V4I3]MDQ0888091.1 hypothetical protein [Paenibacillus sp. V4I9]